jgi:hypothetical protein
MPTEANTRRAYHRAIHEAQEAAHGERSRLYIGVSAFMPPELIELLRSGADDAARPLT